MCTFRAAVASCGPYTKHLRILARPLRKRKRPTSLDARTHKQQTNGVIRTVVIGKLGCIERGLFSASQSFLFGCPDNRIVGNITDVDLIIH